MSQGNVSLEAVKQIVDMGIPEDQAVQALQISNGNVEGALEFIFQGGDASQQPQDVPAYDQGNLDYPIDEKSSGNANSAQIEPGILQDKLPPYGSEGIPPPVPSRDNQYNSVHIENADYENSQVSSDSGYLPDHEATRLHQHNYEQQLREEYSIYNDVTKFQRSDEVPPLLMPVRNGVLESYLNPLLTILREIPSFRKAVYEQHFETLGFHPRWYKGEAISIPEGVSTKVKDGHEVDLRLLLEVQRLFAFLDGDSLRSFASILNFIKSFPKEAQREFHRVESIYEAYQVFYKALANQLEAAGVDSPFIFFESTLCSDESEGENSFGMFHVEAEELNGDLYRTIHNILWGEDLENREHVLTTISDVVPISFEPSYHHAPFGIEVPEVFYPQVYTAEFKETINELIMEKEESEKERREIAKELMNLRVYQGKNVSALLNTSVDFLSSEADLNKEDDELASALKDLQFIKHSNELKIAQLLEKQDLIAEGKKGRDPYNIKTILERHGSTPEPYLLTGVILSHNEFLFLKKPQDLIELDSPQWVHVVYDPATCNNLKYQYTSYDYIKRTLYSLTRSQFSSSMVLVYVKESSWNSKSEYERADSVKQFIKKDIEELGKSLELLVSSSSDESDNGYSNIDDEGAELEKALKENDDAIKLQDSTGDDESEKENNENYHSNNPFR